MTKTVTSPTDASLEKGMRVWGNALSLWRLCGNAACRRARACRGNVRLCFPRNFPLLPEGVRDWFEALAEARARAYLRRGDGMARCDGGGRSIFRMDSGGSSIRYGL
jgi:hypothetical protein